jgi:hypothetical protein
MRKRRKVVERPGFKEKIARQTRRGCDGLC